MKHIITNVTVNGEPLEVFLAIKQVVEAEKARKAEIRAVSIPSPTATAKRTRNHSGARTGRGRILYSASDSRWAGTTPEQALALNKLSKLTGGAL
jgi:hypothetical protein